jgi:hypothetical protein
MDRSAMTVNRAAIVRLRVLLRNLTIAALIGVHAKCLRNYVERFRR